jgi:hypothetical protein
MPNAIVILRAMGMLRITDIARFLSVEQTQRATTCRNVNLRTFREASPQQIGHRQWKGKLDRERDTHGARWVVGVLESMDGGLLAGH